jgi:hypothetical protein
VPRPGAGRAAVSWRGGAAPFGWAVAAWGGMSTLGGAAGVTVLARGRGVPRAARGRVGKAIEGAASGAGVSWMVGAGVGGGRRGGAIITGALGGA